MEAFQLKPPPCPSGPPEPIVATSLAATNDAPKAVTLSPNGVVGKIETPRRSSRFEVTQIPDVFAIQQQTTPTSPSPDALTPTSIISTDTDEVTLNCIINESLSTFNLFNVLSSIVGE